MSLAHAETLPSTIRDGLSRLADDLRRSLGDALLSVVLFGELARGEVFRVGHGDVRVMIVLERVTTAELDRLTPAVQQGIRRYRLAPMILSLEGLRRSTDVFPIKFLDMQQHHQLLAGRDVLAKLQIHDHHVRLRCEQELKNLHLRLHAQYVRSGGRGKQLREVLERAIDPFLLNVWTLLKLKQGTAPTERDDVIAAASDVLELDGTRLQRILKLRTNASRLPPDELKTLFGGLMHDVQRAALIADEL